MTSCFVYKVIRHFESIYHLCINPIRSRVSASGVYKVIIIVNKRLCHCYNSFNVYCRELAPGIVSLTGDRAQGDDSKHDSHYTLGWYYSSLYAGVIF